MLALTGPYHPRIVCAGISLPRRSSQSSPGHCTWLLTLTEGSATRLQACGGRWRIPEGGVWLLPPGEPFTVHYEGSARCAWIHCAIQPRRRGDPLDAWTEFDLALPGRRRCLQPAAVACWGVDLPPVIGGPLADRARATVLESAAIWAGGDPAACCDASTATVDMVHALVRQTRIQTGPRVDEDSRYRLARDLAQQRHGRGIAVADLALAAGLERTRFSRGFTDRYGIGPGAWLRALRLERAAALLAAGHSVTDTARRSGYADPAAFRRAWAAAQARPLRG